MCKRVELGRGKCSSRRNTGVCADANFSHWRRDLDVVESDAMLLPQTPKVAVLVSVLTGGPPVEKISRVYTSLCNRSISTRTKVNCS